jgi:hypothetical protein
MLNTYELKLPSLSDELTNQLLLSANSYDFASEGYDPIVECSKIDYEHKLDYHIKTNTVGAAYKKFDIPKELHSAILSEMTDNEFPFSSLHFYFQIITDGKVLCPHRDPGRITSVIYNLSADNAKTNFYDLLIDDPSRNIFTTTEISPVIESHVLSPFKWHLLNNNQVHDVTEITTKRIAIACGIAYTFKDVCNYYKDTLISIR